MTAEAEQQARPHGHARERWDGVWTGEWVERRLGVRLPDPSVRELLGLALRRNPRRAQLLVSQVLGKHVPQLPSVVYRVGYELGLTVRQLLGPDAADAAVVLGYAETATGLGHCVADGLGGPDRPAAPYLHSTRRPVAGVEPVGGFEEEHSHATSHLLLPADPGFLGGGGPLVLVDDELSTGRTVLNTVAALHRRFPRTRYVVAALVDLRGDADRELFAKTEAELGVRIEVAAVASGVVELPEDVLARGAALVAAEETRQGCGVPPAGSQAPLTRVDPGWPSGLPDGGRHGFTAGDRQRLDAALPGMAERLAEAFSWPGAGAASAEGSAAAVGPAPAGLGGAVATVPRRVLVLGYEELMYTPLRLAAALQERFAAASAPSGDVEEVESSKPVGPVEVRFSTTTRSPALTVDHPGYALRTRLAFPAHDAPADGEGLRYAYNVAPGRDLSRRFDAIVLVIDDAADRAPLHAPGRGLLDRLRHVTDEVLLVTLPAHRPRAVAVAPASAPAAVAPASAPAAPAAPAAEASAAGSPLPAPLHGPAFGSYRADEVSWLLKDLAGITLEAPTEEREEAIQQGGAHYAESLPVEYQPTPAYQQLFQQALAESAGRIAEAVATVTETVLAERGHGAVLASLARAGTPVGILMRRWAQRAHGIDLPHYAVSIVRGRGIDPTALRYLADRHDPADVVFVDGWTGKGAITRELAEALAGTGFNPEMAVLADPGHCVRTFGTREDFLIPSACLNSTVSGLVSRTVLRADLIGPDDFHGAKFYRELADADVSNRFLDAVTERFPEVAVPDVRAGAAADTSAREPDWSGWAAVERISEEYGINSVNLVKPGVGETTRVLLRRVPWRVLVREGAEAELRHVRLLAEQRGVPVEVVGDLPYSCVGLIHPEYTRGATGDGGTAV
ncbi:phosphoribosyltransferase [Streptacidiphilus cavernicola]|uniref:Phosphoribosyltransferase n=1 Tax=Streptacidiphilus cavernicola TaxID=3342716 RepID=A0ABV6VRQ1_9ACTN